MVIMKNLVSETQFYKFMGLVHIYIVFYRFLYPMENKDDTYFGGDWKYLTHWNAMIQTSYFLVNGFLSFNPIKQDFTVIRHHIFACIVFPLASFVSVMFWGLYNINPDLVINPDLEYQESSWFNHMKHTAVLLWVLLESVVVNHVYPGKYTGAFLAAMVSVAYLCWVNLVYFMSSYWVYPILEKLGFLSRLVFFGGIISFYLVLHFVGRLINIKVHSKSKTEHTFSTV